MMIPQLCIIQLQRHNFQNPSYFIRLALHHTYKSSFKSIILHRKSINISKNQIQMEVIQQIDTRLAQNVPYYSEVATFTVEQCKASYQVINNLYQCSANKVKKAAKVSKQFKKDLIFVISQTTEDLLEYIEEKLDIECPESDEKNRTKRLMNIYNELKNKKILVYVDQFVNFNKDLLNRGRLYGQKHLVPLFITVKATVIVSRQMLMEIFNERLGQLRMTYKCHKDTITMFWSGEFKQEKVIEKIKENFGSIKQLTINFVQKGLQIKISKKDLTENYHNIMNMLTELLKGVSSKSVEQWTETKTKTMNLYHSVLNRIKQREIQIKSSMVKQSAEGEQTGKSNEVRPQNTSGKTQN